VAADVADLDGRVESDLALDADVELQVALGLDVRVNREDGVEEGVAGDGVLRGVAEGRLREGRKRQRRQGVEARVEVGRAGRAERDARQVEAGVPALTYSSLT
jgi:hypothetical protein